MIAAKEEAKKLIESIPDNATWDQIMYELYVRKSIEEGLRDMEAGHLISQEEMEKRYLVYEG